MGKTKTLGELGLTLPGGQGIEITGLAVDSREVRPGFLFAALPGSNVHGGDFIQYAVRQGAAAVLTDRQGVERAGVALGDTPAIIVDDPRQSLAYAAALWFGAQPETMVAVTGTNGKTSVASFTRQIWAALGHATISVGTTGVEGDWTAPLSMTTPEPITLHRLLADASSEGITHGAMEASSHGLAQGGSMGCTSLPLPSPTSARIIWITTIISLSISLRRRGCSTVCFRKMGLRSSISMMRVGRKWR